MGDPHIGEGEALNGKHLGSCAGEGTQASELAALSPCSPSPCRDPTAEVTAAEQEGFLPHAAGKKLSQFTDVSGTQASGP